MSFAHKTAKKTVSYTVLFSLLFTNFWVLSTFATPPSLTATEVTANNPWVQSVTTITLNGEFDGISSVIIDGCTIIWWNPVDDTEDLDCRDGNGLILDMGGNIFQATRFWSMQFNNYSAEQWAPWSFLLTHTGTPVVGSPTITPTNFDITVDNTTVWVAPVAQVVDFTGTWIALTWDQVTFWVAPFIFSGDYGGSSISLLLQGLYEDIMLMIWWVTATKIGDTVRVTATTPGTPFIYSWSYIDNSTPILTEVTPIPAISNDNTPTYVFNSNEDGMIWILGDCNLYLTGTTASSVGNNSPYLGTLPDGSYTNCSITVTDIANHISTPLEIPDFIIDTVLQGLRLDGSQSNFVNTPSNTLFIRTDEQTNFTGGIITGTNVTIGSMYNTNVSEPQWWQNFTINAEGPFSLTVWTWTYEDLAGNSNTEEFTFTWVYDITPPNITVVDDISAERGETDTFSVNITDTYNIAYVRFWFSDDTTCDINDFSWIVASGTAADQSNLWAFNTYTDGSDNGKYLCVEATDMAGNESYLLSTEPLNIDTPSTWGGGGGASKSQNYVSNPVKTSFSGETSTSIELNAANDEPLDNEVQEEAVTEITPEVLEDMATPVTQEEAKNYFDQIFGASDKPEDTMTRAELLKKLFDLNGINYSNTDIERDTFSDLKAGDWKSQVAYTALDRGIANGYPDGTFQPDAIVSRIEALKLIMNFNKISTSDTFISLFIDVLENWMKKFVETAKSLWIISGQETADGLTFRPYDAITKAEAAKIIIKSKK